MLPYFFHSASSFWGHSLLLFVNTTHYFRLLLSTVYIYRCGRLLTVPPKQFPPLPGHPKGPHFPISLHLVKPHKGALVPGCQPKKFLPCLLLYTLVPSELVVMRTPEWPWKAWFEGGRTALNLGLNVCLKGSQTTNHSPWTITWANIKFPLALRLYVL